ncbi:MAG: hypothetical protein LLG00_11565 [Planctomycetaceae bacterium]|nr:hypothetical protein [Planctomycetaceae bacterium]
MKRLAIMFLATSLVASMAWGATIDLSNHGEKWTVPTGGVITVPVMLTNGVNDPAKCSVDLELVLTGTGMLPRIQNIDLLAGGAIFEGGTQYPTPCRGIGTSDAFRSVDLGGGATNAGGFLANVVIDTTGIAAGEYTLAAVADGGLYTGTKVWDEEFNEVSVSFQPGVLTVVPEPSALATCVIVAFAALASRCLRSKKEGAAA